MRKEVVNLNLTAAAKCDAGERNNEDSAYLKLDETNNVFVAVIADGVGGLNGGEIASRYITKSIELWFDEITPELAEMTMAELQSEMLNITERMHEELLDIAYERHITFGSTMTFAIIGKKKYNIVQVGDSRAYILNGNWVALITKDQTVAEYEKETGEIIDRIPEKRKEHVLMQCMGAGKIEPKLFTGVLPNNFDMLLCSDGLSNKLNEVDIKTMLKKSKTCSTALNRMIEVSRNRGEEDNITGILIRRRSNP